MTSYIVRLGFLAVFLMIFSSPVLAEDSFGARFGSESAAALDDPSPEALAGKRRRCGRGGGGAWVSSCISQGFQLAPNLHLF